MAMAAPGQLNAQESPSWGSRNSYCFVKLEQIGEVTYGILIRYKDFQVCCGFVLVASFCGYAFTVIFSLYPTTTIICVFLSIFGVIDKACNALRALNRCIDPAKADLSRTCGCPASRIDYPKPQGCLDSDKAIYCNYAIAFVIMAVALVVCGFPVSVTFTGLLTLILAYSRFTEEAFDAATDRNSSVVDVEGPQIPLKINADDRLVTEPEFQDCLKLGNNVPVVSVTSQASCNESHYPDPNIMRADAAIVTSFVIFVATSSVAYGLPASVAFTGAATIIIGYDQYINKVRPANTVPRHQPLFSYDRVVTKPILQDQLESGNDVPFSSIMSKTSCSQNYDPHSFKMEMTSHDDYLVIASLVIFVAASAVACGFPAIAAYIGVAIFIYGYRCCPTARELRMFSHGTVCARTPTPGLRE